MKCPRTRRVVDDVSTDEVSASGLSFTSAVPHGLRGGDRLEVQLVATVAGRICDDMLIMATRAVVVWAQERTGALRFEAPLAY